jgi:hypothetical protein
MSTLRTRITVPIAIVSALLMAPALSGCGIVGGIVNQATGGQVDLGGKKVPDTFPKDQIPLIDGEIIYGAGINADDGSHAWSVLIKVAGPGAIDDITAQLEGAGFTKNDVVGGTTDAGATAIFDNDNFNVAVIIGTDKDNGAVATYTVVTKDKSN